MAQPGKFPRHIDRGGIVMRGQAIEQCFLGMISLTSFQYLPGEPEIAVIWNFMELHCEVPYPTGKSSSTTYFFCEAVGLMSSMDWLKFGKQVVFKPMG